jgi:hypothetical protein
MIIKNVHSFICSSKNTLPSKYKYWMTKMWGEDSEPVTTSQLQESNLSSALCPWGLTKVGTRFSSTCQTSHVVPTGATTSRLYVWLFTRIVGLEEYTFRIDCTASSSCHLSSSCSFPSRSSSDRSIVILLSIATFIVIYKILFMIVGYFIYQIE